MFSKLFSQQSSNATEATPMLHSNAIPTTTTNSNASSLDAQQAAQIGMAAVQQFVEKIQRLNDSAPYSFRALGLAGGLAVILSNALFLPGRLLTLHWTNAVISFYCIVFGIVIVLLELDGGSESQQHVLAAVQEGVRHYAKFLEFTWGRGLLYVFVGTLQAANSNWVDWLVGTFMVLVGTVAGVAGVKTAHDLRRFRMTMKDERDIQAKFRTYDTGKKGYLTLLELREWIQDAGFTMSPNQTVSAYLALNKKFDDKLSQDEIVEWWERPKRGNLGLEKYTV